MRRQRKKRVSLTYVSLGIVLALLIFILLRPSILVTIFLLFLIIITAVIWGATYGNRFINEFKDTREKALRTERSANTYVRHEVEFLTPRQFEFYVADIFEMLGCKSEVTPGSNDEGIDIILKFDKEIMGVQVKKLTGKVGRPTLQNLVGAGFNRFHSIMCVTNADFTNEAQQYAMKHAITLVNGEKLNKLAENAFGAHHIHKALSKKILGGYGI